MGYSMDIAPEDMMLAFKEVIARGWLPYGNPYAIMDNKKKVHHYQAMVKWEDVL